MFLRAYLVEKNVDSALKSKDNSVVSVSVKQRDSGRSTQWELKSDSLRD